MFQVHVELTNEDAGHIFSSFDEPADMVQDIETTGELYRAYQREYGVCRSRVYVGDGIPVGWYFESRQRYEDTDHSYLRGAWVTYREVEPEPAQEDCGTCWGIGELAPMVTCPMCNGRGMVDA